MDAWSPEIGQYIDSHIESEPDYLVQIGRLTHLHTLRPRILSGHLEGRLLKMFCQMCGAKRVLEIGTFTGYSALCMAEALPEDGEVHTVEINDEYEPLILRSLSLAGKTGRKVTLHMGGSEAVIPNLAGSFDVAYLDGNKRRYIEDLELVYPKMRQGGVVVADNTLWDGHVLEENAREAQTVGIKTFNDKVAGDPRFVCAMVPVRDGMTLLWIK